MYTYWLERCSFFNLACNFCTSFNLNSGLFVNLILGYFCMFLEDFLFLDDLFELLGFFPDFLELLDERPLLLEVSGDGLELLEDFLELCDDGLELFELL